MHADEQYNVQPPRSAIFRAWAIALSCSLLGAISVAVSTIGRAAQHAPGSVAPFEHPPLLYDGPDSTANYFLSSPSAAWRLAQLGDPSPVETLPPMANPPDPWTAGPMLNSPDLSGVEALGYGDLEPPPCGITDHKSGFFQKVGVSWGFIDRPQSDEYGLNEFDSFVTVAIPAPTREWPMLISPSFNLRLIDGPVTPDLPAQVYEGFVDFLWVPRLSPRWLGILGVAPSFYGDFDVSASDAFRWTGKGLARFDWIPDRLQILFGVLYLNRDDVRLLPAGGIIWMPNDAKKYELLFPRPKLAHRITVGPHYEDWVYLAGEFGGNTYAIERVPDVTEYITLRDIRVFIGIERKLNGGAGYRIEAGYVFGRRIEFASGPADLEASDTAMVRGGFTY
jgi:hypothetical protein